MPSEPLPDDEWVHTRRRQVGEEIRLARTHARLSQEGLAEAIGRDRQTINRIEMGHVSTRLDTLLRISRAVGVPLSELLREDSPPH